MAVDVRIMAASNRDLEAETKAKRFRADLFFRLAVVTLHIPPLRERREDIPRLVEDSLTRARHQTNRPVSSVLPEAVDALVAYDGRGLRDRASPAAVRCRGPAPSLEGPGLVRG